MAQTGECYLMDLAGQLEQGHVVPPRQLRTGLQVVEVHTHSSHNIQSQNICHI